MELVEKIKNGGKWTTFGFNNKENFSIYFSKIELFLNFKTKSSLSTSVYVSSINFEILK